MRRDAELNAADQVKDMADVRLPRLGLWNYSGVCMAHRMEGLTEPDPGCMYQECGGDLFGYQRVGVAWLHLRQRGLLADDPGVGKWIQLLHLLCLLIQRKELPKRALFVVQTASLRQCIEQTRRWAPNLRFEFVNSRMTKAERLMRYASGGWDMLLIGSHLALRDRKALEAIAPFSLFVSDDVDELLSYSNATHRALVSLAGRSQRSVVCNATSLQTKLEQLHAASLACGGAETFGTATHFQRKHVKVEQVAVYTAGGRRMVRRTTGYKALEEFRARMLPMYLRRVGTNLPVLLPPSTIWLELSPPQTLLYEKLRAGALKLKNAEGVTYNASQTLFQSGQRICAGIPALNGADGPGASPKMDWLMTQLHGVWADRKVVCYMINRGMVSALRERAANTGIGAAVVWGNQTESERAEEIQRFQRDPACRLLIGSKSVERSLNLQAASVLVALDTQLNPARVRQLLGRIRRSGSKHQSVQFFTLLMSNTQEAGYLEVLRKRAALSDYVFDESAGAEVFGSLSALEMLELITG